MPPPGQKINTSASRRRNRGKMAKRCASLLCSHIGLFIIVIAYAIAGAFILIKIEEDSEELRYQAERNVALSMEDYKNYIIKRYYLLSQLGLTKTKFEMKAKKDLSLYHNFIVNKALTANYDGDIETWDTAWTVPKSLLFTITTMGAIGYGHISPTTKAGRLFTVYYGMIGVPLLLVFLANIGEVMGNSFRYIYSRFCCRWCRVRRGNSQLKRGQELDRRNLWSEDVGTESYMPTDLVDVPIMINLCLIAVFLLLGGALFSYWEGWTLSSSAYFTFVTLTTIGFGDYVPGNAFGVDTAFNAALKMAVTIIFVIVGMALLSMAINLMQEQLVGKVKWCARQLGAKGEKVDNKDKYKVKKSPDNILVTPAECNGDKQLADILARKKSERMAAQTDDFIYLDNF